MRERSAQRSAIAKKIWLKFGSDKIVRTYVHPVM